MDDAYSRRTITRLFTIRNNGYQTRDPLLPRRSRLMGHARRRPERLVEKLRRIRITLGLSQTELHKSLGVEEDIPYTRISDYELGKNEPTLIVLLEYARIAGVHLETIVHDGLDLPTKLPGTVKYEPRNQSRSKRRK